MSHNLKALGLALLATFAMSAIVAQAASAHEFTSDSASTFLTATDENDQVFAAGSATVTCDHAEFEGTQTGTTADTVTVIPDYTQGHCTLGGNEAHVDNSGCAYIFDSDTNGNGHAGATLECGHNGSITITGPACTIHFSDTHTGDTSQSPTRNQHLTGVSYTEVPNGDLTVKATVSGISYEGTGFGCSILGIGGTQTNGTYNGAAVVTGYSDAAHTTGTNIGIE